MNRTWSQTFWMATATYSLLFLVTHAFPGSLVAQAQQAGKPLAEQHIPIKVTSDRMEVDNTRNSILFLGNVVVTRADMEMTADRLEVENDQQTNQLKSIAATGNVVIQQAGRRATGDQAYFVEGEEKIVLKGHARATEGANVITGEQMTLFLRTNRTIITGTKTRRVQVLFHPKSLPGQGPEQRRQK